MKTIKYIYKIAAVVLLASLFLHLASYNHQHPKFIESSGAAVIMHGQDKKLWALLLVLKLLALAGVFSLIGLIGLYSLLKEAIAKVIFGKNYLLECLSSGILQPKICH